MTNSPPRAGIKGKLFAPLAIRDITLPNRIAVSPMCEYSSEDGFANDWHLLHLGCRAVGGAGLVMTEATAVQADGRITMPDLGIWKVEHIEPLRRITSFIKGQGSVPGTQLAHAGRQASTRAPVGGGAAVAPGKANGWQVVAPSAVPFREGDPVLRELTPADIQRLVEAFAAAAHRGLAAGFEVIEIHSAHGYGGSFENRARLVLEIVKAVRREMGPKLPLFLRISATDWTEGGWDY